jgi:hypothetical protein
MIPLNTTAVQKLKVFQRSYQLEIAYLSITLDKGEKTVGFFTLLCFAGLRET